MYAGDDERAEILKCSAVSIDDQIEQNDAAARLARKAAGGRVEMERSVTAPTQILDGAKDDGYISNSGSRLENDGPSTNC